MTRRCIAVAAALLAGCATHQPDSFAVAQDAMRREDLLTALLAYDAVPVLHPRYPEARAGAAAVELRMRRGHELMLEGLIRRGEWQDEDALRSLLQAREVWPDLPGVDALIVATRHRLDLFGNERPGTQTASVEPVVVPTPPVAVLMPEPKASRPDDAAQALPAPGPEAAPIDDALPPGRKLAKVDDESIVLGLVAVENRLVRGELELAVVDLLELARRFPDDVRVQRRLARVLQQRGLLRYGQGALTAAEQDFVRVLGIEPSNAEVVRLLRAVREEARSGKPAPIR